MNQINELPEETRYGHDFNYAQWTANTRITLCNVPWGNSYRDIVRFARGQDELNEYIDAQAGASISIPGATYHRPGHPIRLSIPYGKALGFNYLRAYNPPQPGQSGDVGQTYYYFIGSVNHLSPSTTEFSLQLDVIQSYLYRVQFGNCYIQQGHIGVANDLQFVDNGREYLTIPEGLDVGAELQISYIHHRQLATAKDPRTYAIMVLSTVSLDDEPGTIEEPKLKTATGNGLENLPNGAEAFMFKGMAEFNAFLRAYRDKPWITQGIISITAIPMMAEEVYGMETTEKTVNGVTVREVNSGSLVNHKNEVAKNWRDDQLRRIPQKYRHLKKFLTYPYTVLELTTNTGTPVILKPELMEGDGINIVEVPHFAQPGPRMMFYPFRYNTSATSLARMTDDNDVFHDGGEFIDIATGIFNFPTFSLVNNSYMSFMASNVNNIAYQHSSADWSQQRAMAGSQVGYNQATSNIGTSQELTSIGIDASRQSTSLANETSTLRGVQSAATGALNSLGSGRGAAGAMGSIAGAAASTAIDINQNESAFNISSSAARRSNAATTGNMAYARDTNKDYADFAAKGDYQNTIAGINAKVQDAALLQPTVSGQVGGEAFLLAAYRWGYDVKIKSVSPGVISRVGDIWLRYGYSVQRFGSIPADLACMTNFTYWKLSETYLNGNIPETFKEAIRGIFEKGVTVWRAPHLIGRIKIEENYPLEGIRL